MQIDAADLDDRLADAKALIERTDAQLAKTQGRADMLASELSNARVAVETSHAQVGALERDMEVARQTVVKAREEAKAAGEEAAELCGRLAKKP